MGNRKVRATVNRFSQHAKNRSPPTATHSPPWQRCQICAAWWGAGSLDWAMLKDVQNSEPT